MKVVFLPGLDGTGDLFHPFIKILPDDVDPLIISYPPDIGLSYKALTDYVITRLPDERFILLVDSFSGPIGYQIAFQKPEHLETILFVATFINNPRPLFLRLARVMPKSLIFSMPVPNLIIKAFLVGFFGNNPLIELFKQSIKQVSAKVVAFRINEIANLPYILAPLNDIRAIYIQAASDRLIPQTCAKDFQNIFQQLHIHQVKGPHFLLQTNPCPCAEILVKEVCRLKNMAP